MKLPESDREKGCFIATAVFGSEIAKEVIMLRQYRDKILLKSLLGKIFVSTYYFFSPKIAKIVSKSNFLRRVIKTIIINPLLNSMKGEM